LSEFVSNRVRAWVEAPLRFLARVPPIVYGYFAVATFLPALDKLVPGLDKRPALSAGIAVAVMIVPRFLEQSRAAIATVSQPVRDAACALGASKFGTAIFVVIPAVHRRLLAALLLAASRAVGETMIVLVVFTAYASKHATTPSTLTTFLVPNGTRTATWENPIPKNFFIVGCALLFLSLALDTVYVSLDKPIRGDIK
jgi:phosphate transport system permease protein